MTPKPPKIVPLRERQPKPPAPKPLDTCPHGVPLHLDCASCHGEGDNDAA